MIDDESFLNDMTPEEREEYRLNELIGPLFDLMLRFEKAFARLAIDKCDLSDADAEAAAKMFGDGKSDGHMGPAFAYFLRQVKITRILRTLAHQFEVVRGDDAMLSLPEIADRYRQLEEQNKVGKA